MILFHLSSEKDNTLFNLSKKDEEKFHKRINGTLSKLFYLSKIS